MDKKTEEELIKKIGDMVRQMKSEVLLALFVKERMDAKEEQIARLLENQQITIFDYVDEEGNPIFTMEEN